MKTTLLCTLLAFVPAASADDSPKAWIRDVVAYTGVVEVLPTGSMRPSIDENDYLMTVKLPWNELRVGDVIIFKSLTPFQYDGRTYHTRCHRIVARSEPHGWFLVTQGDANPRPDLGYVTEDRYVTCVVGWVMKPERILGKKP